MSHGFRTRLLQGDLLIGTMVTLTSPEVIEIEVQGVSDVSRHHRAAPTGFEPVSPPRE